MHPCRSGGGLVHVLKKGMPANVFRVDLPRLVTYWDTLSVDLWSLAASRWGTGSGVGPESTAPKDRNKTPIQVSLCPSPPPSLFFPTLSLSLSLSLSLFLICFKEKDLPMYMLNIGPQVGTFFPFLGLGFPYNSLKTKKGTLLFLLLLGRANPKPSTLNPEP